MTKRQLHVDDQATPGEEWRLIPWSGGGLYEGSSAGRVRRRSSGRIVKQRTRSRDGYQQIDLCCGARRETFGVHTLICEAFHGQRPGGWDAAHEDGIKSNNVPGNLVWATRAENVSHKKAHGTQIVGEGVAHSVLTAADVLAIRERHEAGETGASIARAFSVPRQTVAKIVRRERWAHIPPA